VWVPILQMYNAYMHVRKRSFRHYMYSRKRWKWQEDEEEDVRSYWITLRTGEDILI